MAFEGKTVAVLLLFLFAAAAAAAAEKVSATTRRKNAYATMMYMGTPRDYEFYVATRVMLRSLVRLGVNADLVVIASLDVPLRWIRALYVFSFITLFFIID